MIGDKYKYYETLQVSPDANDQEIKISFKNLAKKWHPDRNPGREQACKEKFINIYTAYQVLSDERARGEYDRFLNALKKSNEIDLLLEKEELFNEWIKKSKKHAAEKFKEFKTKGDDFVDVLINFSVGIIKITGIGIKRIVKAGKNAIDKTFTDNQKKAISAFSRNTAKNVSFFMRSIFNVILWSGAGLALAWFIANNVSAEVGKSTLINLIWLGITMIALIYNFIFRKPKKDVG
jgi:curved DNA-binding protein CbpA